MQITMFCKSKQNFQMCFQDSFRIFKRPYLKKKKQTKIIYNKYNFLFTLSIQIFMITPFCNFSHLLTTLKLLKVNFFLLLIERFTTFKIKKYSEKKSFTTNVSNKRQTLTLKFTTLAINFLHDSGFLFFLFFLLNHCHPFQGSEFPTLSHTNRFKLMFAKIYLLWYYAKDLLETPLIKI